jgi:pimeloyl-ACP methyl ester carboxylesterase/DNA-binding CsgD family transcriptional regulator
MDAPPVQYAKTSDGYDIAYTVIGQGSPFIFMPITLNHVELEWRHDKRISPWYEHLARRFRFIRYDGRGQGLSTRGFTTQHRMSDNGHDLEAVIEHLGLQDFVLLGHVGAAHVAIRYAVEHPQRVRALILVSALASLADIPVIRLGLAGEAWELFLRMWIPEGLSHEEVDEYLAYFRQTSTREDFARHVSALATSDVSELLRLLNVHTLVPHPREFLAIALADVIELSAAIPGARLALIDGRQQFGDADQATQAIDSFMATLPNQDKPINKPSIGLSEREVDVLRLIVAGKSSREIGEALVLSVRTVERHIANIYTKTDTHGRAQVTAYALQRGIS